MQKMAPDLLDKGDGGADAKASCKAISVAKLTGLP